MDYREFAAPPHLGRLVHAVWFLRAPAGGGAPQPVVPDGRIELVVGGERVDPPARLCVDGDAALEAVRTFVSENGARSGRLQWSAETG